MAAKYRKRLRRQQQRQKRRELYRQMREDQLLDAAYRGLTEEQEWLDQQLSIQQEWLNKLLK